MNFQYLFCMPNKWTFEMKPIQTFIINEISKRKNILIPFAGQTRFNLLFQPQITYIDIEPNRPQPYILGDCRTIMEQMIQKHEKFDCIISDPPFCFFQAVHTYHNQKLQDISYCKELYDQLLSPGGSIIHLGFNSTGMGMKRGYTKTDLLIVNQGGSHNDILILKEIKN